MKYIMTIENNSKYIEKYRITEEQRKVADIFADWANDEFYVTIEEDSPITDLTKGEIS